MSTPPPLPSLPGLSWSRKKSPQFATRVAAHVSGREARVPLQQYPLYEFEAVYSGLSSSAAVAAAQAGLGASSLQSLMGFFLQMQGQFATFLYSDPDDNTVAAGAIGTGDGTTASWLMMRTLGGFAEPVGWVTNIAAVYFNGAAQPSSSYELIAPDTLAFLGAPSSGVVITADFTFAYQCRFLDDRMDFEEFMSSLWKLDGMKFRSVKANTTAAPPPPWYAAYEIGGVAPTLWADFTTEGALNHYLYSGTTYSGYAALFTALGLTFSRASTAYYRNASSLLASAANNALRFGHSSGGSPLGLLLEGASTNLLTQSNAFATSPWALLVSGETLTQNATGPDGATNSAWTASPGSFGGSGLNAYYQNGTFNTGSTFSVFAKAGTATWAYLIAIDASSNFVGTTFNLSAGAIGTQNIALAGTTSIVLTNGKIESYANGWYRISTTITGAAASIILFGASDVDGTVGGRYPACAIGHTGLFFGAQFEALPFPTSYIPTTSATASRAADSLSAVTWPVMTAGTLYAQADAGYTAQAQRVIQIDDGTESNRASLLFNASAAAEFDFLDGGASEAALTAGTITASTLAQMASAFQANDFALVEGGGTPATASSGAVPTFSKLRLGADSGGTTNLYGHIAQIGVWSNLRGPNNILQSLT